MEFLSFRFAGFVILGLLAFHFFQGIKAKRFVFLALNCSFIFFLVPHGASVYFFIAFLVIGFVFIQIIRICGNRVTLCVSILSMVLLFMYFKNYSILYFVPRIDSLFFVTGIPYILFRVIHLLVDVYEGAVKDKISGLDYFNYTCFFLSFVSGPIQRFEDFKGQEKKFIGLQLNQNDVFMDFSRIADGLIKIGFVAVLFQFIFGEFSHRIENQNFPMQITYACAALLYTQFLYFNFSGYMDVVIGIGRLFGLQLPENFNKPFQATNFLDVWSRWHMTLSGWCKIYIFNPLLKVFTYNWPSPRASIYLTVFSFFVTFFVMGLWHGSTNIFVVLGLFLGLGVSLNKLYQISISRWLGKKAYRLLKEKEIYCLICSAMTYSYFSFALTCLWANEERFFLIIGALGIKGLLFGFATAVLISGCILFALSTLRTVWLNLSKGNNISINNHWRRELYLASKVFVIIFVVIEGNIPEFIYEWF
jgi:alginate O-acetyltransferase complex protein AlgI